MLSQVTKNPSSILKSKGTSSLPPRRSYNAPVPSVNPVREKKETQILYNSDESRRVWGRGVVDRI